MRILDAQIAEINMYIYQKSGWPSFTWDQEKFYQTLVNLTYKQGHLIGQMEALGFALRDEASLNTMTMEILKSNEIEGEILDYAQVRSSIARRLGMDIAGLVPSERDVDGVVEVMLDATKNFQDELNEERLFAWHSALFPTGRSGMSKIIVGNWRNNEPQDPMQVVSGAIGKEKVHFQALEAKVIPKEMTNFLEWFNKNEEHHKIIKAAVAHLWFVTLHPFDDGNGRISRTIADMMLTRSDGVPYRFYSMSAQIRKQRSAYYDILERTQKGTLDITNWIVWFLECLENALTHAEESLANIIYKAHYWNRLSQLTLNDRQKKLLNMLLGDFVGKLTSSKWAKIANCSQDTAGRDIQNLIFHGVLEKEPEGGRSTNYSLVPLKLKK